MPKWGAHVSIAGGMERAIERARKLDAGALQIFVKSSNRWAARPFAEGEVDRFRAAATEAGLTGATLAHASYLINLASPDDSLWKRSIEALLVEIERCRALGIPYLVLHPGSHVGSGEDAGLARIGDALDEIFGSDRSRTDVGDPVRVLLEITAGQGSNLGCRFEHLGSILEASAFPDRLAACFDTCHAFAAGFDLRTDEGYASTFESFDRHVGLDRLLAFHLNDSKFPLGSRRDRHEQLGEGEIGPEAFRRLVRDERFQERPMVLETPKGEDGEADRANLAKLRAWAA